MRDDVREALVERMQRYPEVRWDRWIEFEQPTWSEGSVYGWIDREDEHADFFIIEWTVWEDGTFGFGCTTSSARYSEELTKRLNGEDATHVDCRRVELDFPEIENAVRL